MRKLLLRLLSDDTDRLDILEGRIKNLEADFKEHLSDTGPARFAEPAKIETRKRIVTRTMSDFRQAMGDEEIHVPQG